MRSSSLLSLAVFLVLGTLAAQAAVVGVPSIGQLADRHPAPVKGQNQPKPPYPAQVHNPYRGLVKPGVCPQAMMRCAMMNPPDACRIDSECPGLRKCCLGPCGKACLLPH